MGNKKDLFIASMLGGAIGDSLGYSVEFMKLKEIKNKYGDKGITDLNLDIVTGKALISDDTQMTLFTADGIVRACTRGSRGTSSFTRDEIYQSYLRWYYTQTNKMPRDNDDCILQYQRHEGKDSILNYKELFSERAPGISCLTALSSGKIGTIKQPINDSKGCGGVMRIAPIGLFLHNDPEYAFQVGCDAAAITHGHPTGYLSAGALAAIIAELINGKSILESTLKALEILKKYPNHKETLNMIEFAIELSNSDDNAEDAMLELGEGWVAEEALAIALYCALKEKDFKKALIMSVNHDGDSDSTGAICGNILGAYHGIDALPKEWVSNIELKALIVHMGNKLFHMANERNTNTETKKIPKISRQLILLHIFLCSKVIKIKEITNLIKINNKTILRDLQELQNAGLLSIKFSRKEKGYIHINNDNCCTFSEPIFSDNKAKNIHLEKLIRLATIMIELRCHEGLHCNENGYKNGETCSSWYKRKFPNVSRKTMQRDFIELDEIGYEIKYNRSEKCYMVYFPEGLEAIEDKIRQLQVI